MYDKFLALHRAGAGVFYEPEKRMKNPLIGKRIKLISNKLCKVSNQRELGRNRRIKMGIPRICLVGYTNAGKTSLFNKLTNIKDNVA